jgi:hypothetical protein
MSENRLQPSKSPGKVGLSTGLQPGGTIPGKSPAAGVGSIGTGGGSTDNRETGTLKSSGSVPADEES